MSHFGDRVRMLRKEKGLTLEKVAKGIGSNKGYLSGIENGKVNPPSVKLIKNFATLFAQDARTLARLAWVDKAPLILREDAENFLEWVKGKPLDLQVSASLPREPALVPSSPDSAPEG